jgi:hypothetical protein
MHVFRERGLELRFPAASRVLRWDADAAYRDGLRRRAGTKAVDFCVVTPSDEPVLLEVSDLRGHRIENKRHVGSGGLALEMAQKVRDTIAGLVWACERDLTTFERYERLVSRFVNRHAKLDVILWLEEDRPCDPASADALRSAIHGRLRAWLNARVVVTSRQLERLTKHPLQWVDVRGVGADP